MARKLIVLVHGWSVHNTDTYGELAARLEQIGKAKAGLELDVANIWLSRYVSFRDEVRVEDLSRALRAALAAEILPKLTDGARFACITHSTGGPVVRDWWHRYYLDVENSAPCPMSHLIMLAPANFGSALAQLGKSRLSRISTFFESVEPGTGVLDWLELGSPESWALNRKWITRTDDVTAGTSPVFPFVLTGQTIDRKLYDHLNSYTGEVGSDGVVRAAAANLNATLFELQQVFQTDPGGQVTPAFALKAPISSQRTAFRILAGRSHSGKEKGILRSVTNDRRSHPTVDAIVRCLAVATRDDYVELSDAFDEETGDVQDDEWVELAPSFLRRDHIEIHDRQTMLILRVRDDSGYVVDTFDFKLTGENDAPDKLPLGFLTDRQRNHRDTGTVTLFLNYDLLKGCEPLSHPRTKKVIRPKVTGVKQLGFHLDPHQTGLDLFVRYVASAVSASRERLDRVIKPNETTLVDITVRRVVGRGTYELTLDRAPRDFRDQAPGDQVVD